MFFTAKKNYLQYNGKAWSYLVIKYACVVCTYYLNGVNMVLVHYVVLYFIQNYMVLLTAAILRFLVNLVDN